MEQTTAVPISKPKPQTQRPGKYKRYMWGFIFLLPAIVIFTLFLWLPIFKGVLNSFYNVDFVKGDTFIGFDNYKTIFGDRYVMTAVRNTLYYMGLALVIGFWVPIVFALAISEMRRFQGFARVAAYLPYVVPFVVLYGVWRWLYDPVGPINSVLKAIGIGQINFMVDRAWSMASIVIMETWQSFGSAMLIYLAAILAVPRDWYEAAEIDGAGIWQRIRYITLPAIRNQILLLLMLQLIATSQGFQTQYAMLDGGPNNATLTYALLIVRYAFVRQDYGVASALGVLMFFGLSILAIIQYRINNRGGVQS
ncbi:carbohydrate ABC transporter permease [Paenibacillus paeoniae]|uniref:Sugar ABC transporter permease n=1 Tax=Paenibacillus paeoniae TaxID=2292705 RepID=A0A371PHN0_9BACL|nr:sugar ABC transporter permease [Paenibacillus paeoniae]REK75644.1 sugar ABC transporter permease [Paenibacillus paeoniae]